MNRDRAWRRAKDEVKQRRHASVQAIRAQRRIGSDRWSSDQPKVKKWKQMYTRSEKVARGRQLGFEYPKKTDPLMIAEHGGDE